MHLNCPADRPNGSRWGKDSLLFEFEDRVNIKELTSQTNHAS